MPAETSLRVLAFIVAKPDRVDQMRQLLVSLIAPTLAEDGCSSYELLQNLQAPTDFTVVEEWQSEMHYGGHLSSPHVQEALGKLVELGAAPLEIRRYARLRNEPPSNGAAHQHDEARRP
jgi:quinol monooxygenase YgiN